MKTFPLVLALSAFLLAPTASAQASDADCTGPVCDAICDVNNWVQANPWWDWIASNPVIKLQRGCPIA